MTVLKKAVLDSTTTEVARRFQFQAFDLDGNGTISKSEMDMMMTLVRGAPPTPRRSGKKSWSRLTLLLGFIG